MGWADRGMCHTLVSGNQYTPQEMDSIFFPARTTDEKVAVRRAREICAMCPVKRECLEYAPRSVAGRISGFGAGRRRTNGSRCARDSKGWVDFLPCRGDGYQIATDFAGPFDGIGGELVGVEPRAGSATGTLGNEIRIHRPGLLSSHMILDPRVPRNTSPVPPTRPWVRVR